MQKIGAKLAIIAMVCAIFFVGLLFVGSLVSERQSYHNEVINDIKSSHVSSQLITTPFLISQQGDEIRYIFAASSDIKTDTAVRDDEYKRGIYQAISYQAKLNIHQTFDPSKAVSYVLDNTTPTQNLENQNPSQEAIEQAVAPTPAPNHTLPQTINQPPKPLKLIIALSDLRGVKPTHITVNGTAYPATFNTDNTLSLSYLEAVLPVTQDEFFAGAKLDVRFVLDVSGIGGFGIMPLGDMMSTSLNSNWQNPKFFGQALPVQKSITDNGFEATWQSHALGVQNQRLIMQIAQGVMGNFSGHTDSALMTDFIHVNDTYTQTDRSMKYALLIIMVSFGTFFLFEVIKGLRIHPIQYLMVASALLVFYLLLLSLAEQVAFVYAYVIASTACVGLIGWYACYLLGSVGRGMGFGVVLGSLYVAFYVILSASELNLLMGSVFCFVCVAVAMIATRHVDWYELTYKTQTPKEVIDESI